MLNNSAGIWEKVVRDLVLLLQWMVQSFSHLHALFPRGTFLNEMAVMGQFQFMPFYVDICFISSCYSSYMTLSHFSILLSHFMSHPCNTPEYTYYPSCLPIILHSCFCNTFHLPVSLAGSPLHSCFDLSSISGLLNAEALLYLLKWLLW